MDLPTYTNIWRIEKRLYKLYDLRLPMPLPLVQIGVFLGVFVPWILLLRFAGIPFKSPWHVLYVVPPGVLTWLATRPVIEGKRLTELLLSQSRYLAEPRTWCRLTPIREPREVVVVARVWRRAEAPAPVAAPERAAVKSRRKARKAAAAPAAAPAPAAQPAAASMLPGPAIAETPVPLADYAAQYDVPAPAAEVPAPKPWRRTVRDISHEDDVQLEPHPGEIERPPATPRLEVPPAPAGSGKRGLASGVRRPGAAAEIWPAVPPVTRPDIPQQTPAPASFGKPAPFTRPETAPTAPDQTPERAPAPRPAPASTGPAQQSGDQPPEQAPGLRLMSDGVPAAPAGSTERSSEPPVAPAEVTREPVAPASTERNTAPDENAPTAPEQVAEQAPGLRLRSDGVPAVRAGSPVPPGPSAEVVREPVAPPSVERDAVPSEDTPAPARQDGEQAAPEGAPTRAGSGERVSETAGRDAGESTAAAEEQGARQDVPAARDGSGEDVPAAEKQVAGRQVASDGAVGAQVRAVSGTPGASAADDEARRSQTGEGAPAPGVSRAKRREQFGGEPGDKKVAGWRTAAPRRASAGPPPQQQVPQQPQPQQQVPQRPAAQGPARQVPQPPAVRPPAPTRPDIPVQGRPAPAAPAAFGGPQAGQPGEENEWRPAKQERDPGTPRLEAPRPWSKGLSKPLRPASTDNMLWPPVPEPGKAPEAYADVPPQGVPIPEQPQQPVPQQPVEEQAPPREVRSQPQSPVRPRPLPPPPAPPASGPAITPPGPEHEVTTGGLRRLIQAVGGGHGEVDAEYEQRLQQPFHGTRHVVVLGCTGGAGQTVTSLMLGHTFAQHNGEPVVAIDVNPGPGALARRTRSETNETLTSLITRADQVGSLTAMRRYTSQAKSGLDVIAAGKNPLQALDDRDYALAIRTIDKFYSVTLLDTAAAIVARVLPYADQIVLVAPASADAPRAVAMTFEWLDGHGYEELRSRAVTVINGVSRRSMDDVEQAEAVARGRCRALVRIPWDDHLSMDRAPRNELKSLRAPTRRAYLALAGVVAGGFTVVPERYQELQQEQEATR
ncbi:TcpE family conjugal transfer membrane protein [Actinomadura sp. NTSP31]|uniref:TcpE family conjugal transfer membrane protein n=1 Tax=Actinomadura sp. NTSP31 TaxID=1735447 RepID=UPI0035C06BD9